MGEKRVRDIQAGFSGGLNSVGDPNFLGPDQARQLTNVHLTTFGAATKRGGTRVLNSAVGTGTPGPAFFWPRQSQVMQLAGTTQRLYTAPAPSAFSSTWGLTFTDRGAGPTTVTVPDRGFAVFQAGGSIVDVVYVSADSALWKWDGTTYAVVAGAAGGSGLVAYNSRLWSWRPDATVYLNIALMYSGLYDGDSLGVAASGGGQININTFGNSAIYRCMVVGASLLIFHRRGVSRLSGFGQDDISVEPQSISPEVAILGQQAACAFEDEGWVATYSGLYRVTEADARLVATPDKPDPTVAALAATTLAPKTACFYNRSRREVWVFIPGTGIYIFNVQLGSWSGPFDGSQNAASTPVNVIEVNDDTLLSRYILGADTNGILYETDSPDYYKDGVAAAGTGGSAFTTTIQPHRMFGQDVSRLAAKSWRQANILATLTSGATAPVVAASSQLKASANLTLSNLTSVTQPYYIKPGGLGGYLDLVITDTSTAASQYEMIEVEGFLLGKR